MLSRSVLWSVIVASSSAALSLELCACMRQHRLKVSFIDPRGKSTNTASRGGSWISTRGDVEREVGGTLQDDQHGHDGRVPRLLAEGSPRRIDACTRDHVERRVLGVQMASWTDQ